MDYHDAILSIVKRMPTSSEETPSPGASRPSIRLRPLIRQVARKHAIAYVVSIADKHVLNTTGENLPLLSLINPIWMDLLQTLKSNKPDTFDYQRIHLLSLDTLKHALEFCRSNPNWLSASPPVIYRPWSSLGFQMDSVSVLNRRRRQEDRWFAIGDVINYLPDIGHPKSRTTASSPPISALGVFDGHNGPEAAEHCSHLAPYLLNIGLRQSDGLVPITDLLANVFHNMNQSVNEGRANNVWSSGTTGTIILIQGKRIYTAWVGDSQAWIVYRKSAAYHTTPPPSSRLPQQVSIDQSASHYDEIQQDSGPRYTSFKFDCHAPVGSAMALTDAIHRPEFGPEFVSVVRTGGLVSTELATPHDPTTEKRSYTSASTCKDALTAFQMVCHNPPGTDTFEIPPINNPDLLNCRVGVLSCVSRAIGDDLLLSGISALPSVTVWESERPLNGPIPLCIIVGSDGLWDTPNCSGPHAAYTAEAWFDAHRDADGTIEEGLAHELCQNAINNGASDNVTCVVLWLHRWDPNNCEKSPPPQEIYGKNMRWPRGTRTTSLENFGHTKRSYVRGPNRFPSPTADRNSMFATSAFKQGVRYSSPPRYLSSSELSS